MDNSQDLADSIEKLADAFEKAIRDTIEAYFKSKGAHG